MGIRNFLSSVLLNVKEWASDTYQELIYGKLYDLWIVIKNFPKIVKANLSLLTYFNKHNCYHNWDYDYLYALIAWKLMQIRDDMEGFTVAGVEEKRNYISDEVQCALDCLELFYNPEIMSEEKDRNGVAHEKEYFIKLCEIEEDCWDDFHEILRTKSRFWWE